MPGSIGKLTVCLPCLLLWQLSNPEAAHSRDESVFCIARDGSSIDRLSATEGRSTPSWGPDGRVLYVAPTENGQEFRVVSAGGEILLRVPVPKPVIAVGGVSWFPDGTGIAFAGRTEEPEQSYNIYVMKLDSGEPAMERIVEDAIQPAFSPDGQRLVFTTHHDGNLELYEVDVDGRNLRNLTRHEGHDAHPSWSPDGSRIVFESNRFGNFDICIIEIASAQVVNITDHPALDRQPSWSKDGTEIAFVFNREGKVSIYRMAVDGTGVTRLTSGYDGDWKPAWSPDGESISFISSRPEPFLDRVERWLSD